MYVLTAYSVCTLNYGRRTVLQFQEGFFIDLVSWHLYLDLGIDFSKYGHGFDIECVILLAMSCRMYKDN